VFGQLRRQGEEKEEGGNGGCLQREEREEEMHILKRNQRLEGK